jgi:hypothetical protein
MQSGRYILVCRSDFQFDDVRQSELFQSNQGARRVPGTVLAREDGSEAESIGVLTASTKTACYDTNQPAVTTRPV